jgi:hypothetical protein
MKGSKIWGVGKHHLFINGQPRWVYVSPEALRKDYEILKANLPIPVGIDHLDEKIIQQNKILKKMDLLSVGSIEDVELVDNGIKILKAKITNPLIQELYNQKKLPSWSIVSKVSLKECKSGKVDYVEDYSIINRVDFVEKGACTTCNLEYNNELMNAKSVIGENMAEERNNPGQEGQEGNEEPTLTDVAKAITDFKEEIKEDINKIDERITALEKGNTEGQANNADESGEGSGDNEENLEFKAMKAEIAEMKAKAIKAEAKATVEGYVKEGKIEPKNIDKHVKLALGDIDSYNDMMAEAPVVIKNLGERLSDGQASGNGGSDKKLSKYEQENDINIEELTAEDADN